MAFSQGSPAARRRGLAIALSLGMATFSLATDAQIFCGSNSPAFPVPEFHGSTRLWPTNGFRPARPTQQIPTERDSTQYTTNSFPSAASGHELFWGLDVVGDRAFVMYNVGISAWDIGGANAENPRRIHLRDGIAGDWFYHEGTGEADGFLKDIAALQDPSNANRILISVAALSPVGATVWRFDRVTGLLTQAYQNTSIHSEDVEMIQFGGKLYAFYATSTGTQVIDVSATNGVAEGCIDGACPSGLALGKVASAVASRYVGAVVRNGKVYLAASYGGQTSFSPAPEIWELDPAFPADAVRRFRAPINDTHSPTLFEKGGKYYMAVVEKRHVKIYDVSSCLDGDGCTALPAASFDHTLRTQLWSYDFLSYSVSEGTPFLYYGFEGIFTQGAAFERLFDLSNLGTASPITEMTATGGTYTDACNGAASIGYWSSYYELNDSGFRNYSPRKGKFSGRYFYKVNIATFDVHVRTQVVVNPTVTTVATSSAPYYFGDTVRFSASAQNCDGPEAWTWLASNSDATGLGAGSASASINWALCNQSRCPSENIEVWAIKDACAGSGNLVENRTTINVADPRAQIAAINVAPTSTTPDVYPLCSVLDFTADVSGKAPLVHAWAVRDAGNAVLLSSGSPGFSWNTAGVILGNELFFDGFESGDTSAWNGGAGAAPAPASLAPSAASVIEQVMGAGSADFSVELTLDNAANSPALLERTITLTALGEMAFTGTPIVMTNLGSGQYRFRANTANATRWRWEFEDPGNGSTGGCQFFTKCRILDYGVDDNDVTMTWTQPNLDGLFRVRVQAANCLTVPAISAELTVPVTGIPAGSPPSINTFTITTTPHCSLSLNLMECRRSQAIHFLVGHQGTATHYDFDWEGDGTFEQSVTVGTAISRTYTTLGQRSPKVRARNNSGTPSSGAALPWPLEIIE